MQVKVIIYPDDRLVLSEEANGEQMTKCEQINDLGITVCDFCAHDIFLRL